MNFPEERVVVIYIHVALKKFVYMVQIIKIYLNSTFTVQRTLYINIKPILIFFFVLWNQNASCS